MRRSMFCVMAAVVLIAASSAHATTINTAASGSWGTAASWTPATVPDGDYYLKWDSTSGGDGNVKIDFDTGDRQIARLIMTGGPTAELYFGSGAGTLSVTNTASTNFFGVAMAAGTQGKVTMDGGTLTMGTTDPNSWLGFGCTNINGNWYSGLSGTGTVAVNTGATMNSLATAGGIAVGSHTNASTTQTTFDIAGGTVNANIFRFQRFGDSMLNISDGGMLSVASVGRSNIAGDTPGTFTFNFDDGTLQARETSSTFLPNALTHASVKEGGATIDTQSYDITIDQALEHGGVNAVDGGLTKDGSGQLTLTAINSYTGDTLVDAGMLILSQECLDNASAVRITSGAVLDLSFSQTDTVGALYLGGVAQGPGTYNVSNSGGYITGSGSLYIVPEPGTLSLLAAGLIGLLAYAWRKRK